MSDNKEKKVQYATTSLFFPYQDYNDLFDIDKPKAKNDPVWDASHKIDVQINMSDDDLKKCKIDESDKPLIADTLSTMESLSDDVKMILDEIKFERVREKLYVNLIAIDTVDKANNHVMSIQAQGDSLGGYAYVPESDSYLVSCFDYVAVGIIPIAFRLSVPKSSGKQLIPLPPALIYKYATPAQRKLVLSFIKKFPAHFEYQYIQSLSRF